MILTITSSNRSRLEISNFAHFHPPYHGHPNVASGELTKPRTDRTTLMRSSGENHLGGYFPSSTISAGP